MAEVKKEALEKLWRLGHLSFKMHSGQKDLYKMYQESPQKVQTWLCARRLGKSYTLIILSLEQCIQTPNSIVKYIAPTKLQVNNILNPLFRKILSDCPLDMMPVYSQKDYVYKFHNGSEIQIAGADNGHAEKLRGGDSNLAVVDEAGSCNDLSYLVKEVLIPTTLITKGKILLAGTPPREPDHDFINFIETAEAKNSLIIKTIYDNPLLTKQDIKEAFEELGGENTDESKREYLCQIIKDSKTCVLPEFNEISEPEIVTIHERPTHFDAYVGMDLGGKDLTVALFGYYDFRNNKVVIEDEVIMDFQLMGNTLSKLVKDIMDKEEKLWFNYLTNEQRKPYKRVSDINYIALSQIKELSQYKLSFDITKKDDAEAAINFMREKLQKRQIVIHPRCVTLIRHMRNVKWKKGEKNVFARSPDDGHYDAVEALKYLIRSIDYRRNPYPAHYGREMNNIHVANPEKFYEKTNMEAYRRIFNTKRK